jgi:hydroxymethylglutaryl-CoA lyase
MKLPLAVTLREVSPRDGFQSLAMTLPTKEKLEIIRALIESGVTEIETTSFVSAKAIPQLGDAAEVMAGVYRRGVTHSVMVPNLRGAADALASGADQLVVVISATEAHNLKNVRRSIDASLADLKTVFILARERSIPVIGAVAVAFGCPYQGDVPLSDVFKIIDVYFEKQAKAIILADTTGMATPSRVCDLVGHFKDRFPESELILHLHNNRGIAMANLFSALISGVTVFDTALGGIGGCPYVPHAAGNLPTEDVVFMLEDMGIRTGIDLTAIIRAAKLLEMRLGFTLPGQVMKSGPRISKAASRKC